MGNSNISQQGRFILDKSNNIKYLVNNFTNTGATTDWTLGGNLTNGTAILTGTAPAITSITFPINPDDIVCFEFVLSVPTPSTATSGAGVYLGTKYGQSVKVYSYNMNQHHWDSSFTTTTNPYFITSYNSTARLYIKNYIIGENVTIDQVPVGKSSSQTWPPRIIQMTSGQISTNIRAGYNSNSSMVIHFSSPMIYNIRNSGFCEELLTSGGNLTARIGQNWSWSSNFYEY